MAENQQSSAFLPVFCFSSGHSRLFSLVFVSPQDTAGFNTPLLRPRVIGEWIGREENDADPLAAEMLQPPTPRNKNEQWDSEDSSSPGGR